MKLAIFIREDIDMRTGKIAVQVGHASVLAFNHRCKSDKIDRSQKWLQEGQKKIVLKVPNENTLLEIEGRANLSNLASDRVVDFGLTQIAPNTWTCLAVGPDEDEKIDEITKGFSLL
jgi:peptidyl-tRNA hydrolase, PTH2 family